MMLRRARTFIGFAVTVFAAAAAGARFGRRGMWVAAGLVYVVGALWPDQFAEERLGDELDALVDEKRRIEAGR